MSDSTRVIGRYGGNDQGPLLICIGAIHGNEPAGVEAIRTVLALLEREPLVNPGFTFTGRFLGVKGNVEALRQGRRFISRDLNRSFHPEHLQAIFSGDTSLLKDEDRELFQLISTIREEIEMCKPSRTVILDLHSTSATGGIFVITSDDPESIDIGTELHAPVILDFAQEVKGTTLGYFTRENFGTQIVTVVFECGQHDEVHSVNRAIAAVINCLRTIGCVKAEDVENRYDLLLQEYARGLPKVARLVERCPVNEDASFILSKRYKNFDPVVQGEIVAYNGEMPVTAKHAGLILMPRLQEQGEDGFFVVQPVE